MDFIEIEAAVEQACAGLGYDAVLAPLPNCEEAEDLLREESHRRQNRSLETQW